MPICFVDEGDVSFEWNFKELYVSLEFDQEGVYWYGAYKEPTIYSEDGQHLTVNGLMRDCKFDLWMRKVSERNAFRRS